MEFESESAARAAVKDAYRIVWRAIEGGLLDDVRDPRWPNIGWENCSAFNFREGRRRINELLAGTGVDVYLCANESVERFRLRARLAGNRVWLKTSSNGAVYRVDACSGRRA